MKLLLALIFLFASAVSAQAQESIRVVAFVDLTEQTLIVAVDGEPAYEWPISSGRAGYETPGGVFKPTFLSIDHWSKLYDAPMPYAVFFNGDIATHGTEEVGKLGAPASHGCIRLAPENAATFYSLVEEFGQRAVRVAVFGQYGDAPKATIVGEGDATLY